MTMRLNEPACLDWFEWFHWWWSAVLYYTIYCTSSWNWEKLSAKQPLQGQAVRPSTAAPTTMLSRPGRRVGPAVQPSPHWSQSCPPRANGNFLHHVSVFNTFCHFCVILKVLSYEIGSGHAYCWWIALIKDMRSVDSQILKANFACAGGQLRAKPPVFLQATRTNICIKKWRRH